ncbi:putative sugar kinase YeiI [Frankliniella fusca]|uniref:Sugar kinase YeiI n=1 Tax=Frankliniella fusca TaxID=407009 RepID=A0AAE1HRF1_9NEOP|nr:putative sugar kinase YeiI [Frankliniella fusca]
MAKTLLIAAIAAVLFTLGAVSSSPAPLEQRALQLQLQQLDDTQLQVLGLDRYNLNWINVTAILEKIEGALQAVEDKIADAERIVEQGLQNVLQGITNAALEAATKWNETVVELAEEAQQLGVDVEACIQAEEQPLQDVVEGLKTDAQECLATNVDRVKQALDAVSEVGTEAQDLLARATAVVTDCTQKASFPAVLACLAGSVPAMEIEAGALVGAAALRAAIAGSRAATLVPMAGLCATKATTGRAAQAAGIVDAAAQCIKDKLPQPQ